MPLWGNQVLLGHLLYRTKQRSFGESRVGQVELAIKVSFMLKFGSVGVSIAVKTVLSRPAVELCDKSIA